MSRRSDIVRPAPASPSGIAGPWRSGDDPGDRGLPERAARGLAKAGVRSVTMATAQWRVRPDFIIIGAKRGGTTSVWRFLQAHPQIVALVPKIERVKGTYFLDERHDQRSERWYFAHFPLCVTQSLRSRRSGTVAVGEASPYYLYHPAAPGRAAVLCPDALRIAILRDPVERAFSHWKERVANGTEHLGFLEALRAEPDRLRGEAERLLREPGATSWHHRHHSYVDQGRYASALGRWIDHSSHDQLQVWFYEELFTDIQSHLNLFTERLGLGPAVLPERTVFNDSPPSSMPPEARRFLESELRDDCTELAEMLGRELPWAWLAERGNR